MTEEMLVSKEEYLTSGIHIGMKTCTPYMKRFVYKIREDGLAVFNLQKVDERLKIAIEFLSKFNKIMVVSRKENASRSITAFAKAINCKAVTGRFSPGTLTNPSYKGFYEPDVMLVVDPLIDEQAIIEAKKKRVPVVALCDTFNSPKDIDLIIPTNNNGKKALSLIFWILARELTKKKRGKKTKFNMKIEEFGG